MRKTQNIYIIYFAVILIEIVVLLSAKHYGTEFCENILVELHGVIIDTIIIGSIIAIWAKYKDRNNKIESLINELNIYKAWKSQESSFRIYNIYKLLDELGIKADLSSVHLEKIEIADFVYHGLLDYSVFINSQLIRCDIRYASLDGSKIRDTVFIDCDLRGTHNLFAEISDSKFYNCSFNSTTFGHITFKNVYFEGVDFQNAYFDQVNFIACVFDDVNFDNSVSFLSNFGINGNPKGVTITDDKDYIHEPAYSWLISERENLKKRSRILQNKWERYETKNDKNYI